ncbi:MAG: hypothetical protein JJ895_05035 [Balneolaceae bacterium]|nr:hypothetical protein [Balneolaceae bacterium]
MNALNNTKQKKGAAPEKTSAAKMYNTINIANSDRLSNSFFVGFSLGSVTNHRTREQLLLEFLDPCIQETMTYFELSSFFDGLVKALMLGGHSE